MQAAEGDDLRGGRVRLLGPAAPVRRILDVSGLAGLFLVDEAVKQPDEG